MKMRRCEDEKMLRRRCEDEKMFYRPPLLEEPCAQTLSGKNIQQTKNHGLLKISFPSRDKEPVEKSAVSTALLQPWLKRACAP